MNLWRTLAIASALLFLSSTAFATVYVYEVVTKTKRFQTASKMIPRAFLRYHGGVDVVYELIIIDQFKGDKLDTAIERYKLGDKNYRALSPKASKPNYSDFYRYRWWR